MQFFLLIFFMIRDRFKKIKESLPKGVTLVAVSKTKPIALIEEAYQTGQRIFGENKVQEMVDKQAKLPKDISWHMIGHVQRNKVKYMAPFVDLIHGVDSLKLLKEINKEAIKNDRIISCLLQLKIAEEESKRGMSLTQVEELFATEEYASLKNIKILGLMGMASFVSDQNQIKEEFKHLKSVFDTLQNTLVNMNTLSMGMSGDYLLAIEKGSTMVRLGSVLFGKRE